MNEENNNLALLPCIIRKVLICSGFVIIFFFLEHRAFAAPFALPQNPTPAVPHAPAIPTFDTSLFIRTSSEAIEGTHARDVTRLWQKTGREILHQLAGDDFRSFFGFEPQIKIFRNPLPIAALSSRDKLVFSSGLLELIETPEEYAFLIAHEMAHEMLGHLKSHPKHTPWTLEEELSADLLAFRLLREARLDRHAALSLLEKLGLFGQAEGAELNHLYPTIAKRRQHLRKLLSDPASRDRLPKIPKVFSMS